MHMSYMYSGLDLESQKNILTNLGKKKRKEKKKKGGGETGTGYRTPPASLL